MNSSVGSVICLYRSAGLDAVVLPLGGDALLVEGEQAAVGDGDAVSDPNRCPRASGGCEGLGSTFGPYQSGAGHGATAVGECRTSA
jgi:hypothetical protein